MGYSSEQAGFDRGGADAGAAVYRCVRHPIGGGMTASALETSLAFQLEILGAPAPVREYRFAAEHYGGTGKGVRSRLIDAGMRDWRFDFAWPDLRLAVEIQGGTYIQGAHSRGARQTDDMMKLDAALRLGWTVYQCDTKMVRNGRASDTIMLLIRMRGGLAINLD